MEGGFLQHQDEDARARPNDNWDFRKDALLQELVNSQAAIIGLQEGWTPAVSSIFACSFFIILPSFPHGHKMSQMSQRTLCANFISFISFILSGGETWAVGLPEVVVGRAWLFKYWCWTRCCFHPRMASCIIYIYIYKLIWYIIYIIFLIYIYIHTMGVDAKTNQTYPDNDWFASWDFYFGINSIGLIQQVLMEMMKQVPFSTNRLSSLIPDVMQNSGEWK